MSGTSVPSSRMGIIFLVLAPVNVLYHGLESNSIRILMFKIYGNLQFLLVLYKHLYNYLATWNGQFEVENETNHSPWIPPKLQLKLSYICN